MIKLFTHTDLDGIGCAVLLGHSVSEPYLGEIEYCNYDDIEEKIQKFIDETEDIEEYQIFITDISVSEIFAEKLDTMKNVKIALIDHHATALKLNRFSWCHVYTERFGMPISGTELFLEYLKMKGYSYLTEHGVSRFAETVGDWDTWRWAKNGNTAAKDVNTLLHMIDREEFMGWCKSCLYSNSYFPNFTDRHRWLLEQNDKEFVKYVDSCNQRMFVDDDFYGYKCGMVFADRFISELGNKLCILHPEIDFIAMINPNTGIVSFRTVREDINLGKDIAAKFGGGGHAKAAGCQFSPLVFQESAKWMFGRHKSNE